MIAPGLIPVTGVTGVLGKLFTEPWYFTPQVWKTCFRESAPTKLWSTDFTEAVCDATQSAFYALYNGVGLGEVDVDATYAKYLVAEGHELSEPYVREEFCVRRERVPHMTDLGRFVEVEAFVIRGVGEQP